MLGAQPQNRQWQQQQNIESGLDLDIAGMQIKKLWGSDSQRCCW